MLRALDEYVVHGVQTGIDLHKRILAHPAFVAGQITTGFLQDHGADVLTGQAGDVPDEVFIAAALGETLKVAHARSGGTQAPAAISPWVRVGTWEIGGNG
jgi:acetyl/propionyl-CoA carboxylase alpha subunit